jgi:hypothetical protein
LKRSQDKSVRRKKCNKRTENPTKSKNVDKITYIWEPSTNKAKHSTTLEMYHLEGGQNQSSFRICRGGKNFILNIVQQDRKGHEARILH